MMESKLKLGMRLYSPRSQRYLLSFKDFHKNGYHTETMSEGNVEYVQITNITSGCKNIVEKLPAFSTGLYYTKISTTESNALVREKLIENINVWNDRLGHPGSVMMQR